MAASSSTSLVWKDFTKFKDEEKAKCKICNKVLKCSGGSTSGLSRHSATHRKDSDSEPQDGPSSVKTQKISSSFAVKKSPLSEMVQGYAAEQRSKLVDSFQMMMRNNDTRFSMTEERMRGGKEAIWFHYWFLLLSSPLLISSTPTGTGRLLYILNRHATFH